MAAEQAAEARYLCLNCRDKGHLMSKCTEPISYNDVAWFFSSKRILANASSSLFTTTEPSTPCTRCQRLNLAALLHTPGSESGYKNFKETGSMENILSLGLVGDVVLDNACPVCRCLFIISPSPSKSDQEVLIFATSSLVRVSGINTVAAGEKYEYGKCLNVVLWSAGTSIYVEELRTDALCVLEDSEEVEFGNGDSKNERGKLALLGRTIQSKTYSLPVLKGWLERCEKLHPATCQRVWLDELRGISLLDVQSRQVVKHPQEKCDYIALSYVWGNTEQASVKIGTVLEGLPQTIEDAITFTKALGKNYLWVDSLCIDQGDEENKQQQISVMCSIYQGAYATIVALTGLSADTGLPRVNPQVEIHEQFSCTINGLKLVTTMPTLSHSVFVSAWGLRAWTFQEALLSPRCFYFSRHQVYFECNAMTCCETLNESKSLTHNLYWDNAFIEKMKPAGKYVKGVLRNPFVGESRRPKRLLEYGNLLTLFSYRDMTKDSDAINAFSGILQALSKDLYPKGFYWGLPIEHFNYGLVWTARGEPRRREGFPTWSWAGWQCSRWAQAPDNGTVEKDLGIQPYIWIGNFMNGRGERLFSTSSWNGKGLDGLNDPMPSPEMNLEGDDASHFFYQSNHSIYKFPGLLLIQGIVFRFIPHEYKSPENGKWEEDRQIWTTLHGIHVPILYLYSGNSFESRLGKTQEFLLLARETHGEYVVFRLLMLEFDGKDKNLAFRAGPVRLWLLKDQLGILEGATPVVKTLILA